MIWMTKGRVLEIGAAIGLTVTALVILGWQAWAGVAWWPTAVAGPGSSAESCVERKAEETRLLEHPMLKPASGEM